MLKAVIVEDNDENRKELKQYFQKYISKRNLEGSVELYTNALDFVSDYEFNVDVIFMDIEMPHLNGMEAAKKIRLQDPNVFIAFETNMAQYAVKGYEVEAVGYMVKPVSYFSFEVLMDKVIRKIEEKPHETIVLRSDNRFRKIDLRDLYYIESYGHFLIYHTKDEQIKILGKIGEAEADLEKHQFFRCNKCYLVNLRHVKEMKEDTVCVGNDILKISRRRKKEFLQVLNQYFK